MHVHTRAYVYKVSNGAAEIASMRLHLFTFLQTRARHTLQIALPNFAAIRSVMRVQSQCSVYLPPHSWSRVISNLEEAPGARPSWSTGGIHALHLHVVLPDSTRYATTSASLGASLPNKLQGNVSRAAPRCNSGTCAT